MKTQQQIDNLHLALAWWQTIPPEKVIPKLLWWASECGTCGCFGGWLMASGLFLDQGLKKTEKPSAIPYDCVTVLFGTERIGEWLFSTRGYHRIDRHHPEATDHEIVTLRLWWEIANA